MKLLNNIAEIVNIKDVSYAEITKDSIESLGTIIIPKLGLEPKLDTHLTDTQMTNSILDTLYLAATRGYLFSHSQIELVKQLIREDRYGFRTALNHIKDAFEEMLPIYRLSEPFLSVDSYHRFVDNIDLLKTPFDPLHLRTPQETLEKALLRAALEPHVNSTTNQVLVYLAYVQKVNFADVIIEFKKTNKYKEISKVTKAPFTALAMLTCELGQVPLIADETSNLEGLACVVQYMVLGRVDTRVKLDNCFHSRELKAIASQVPDFVMETPLPENENLKSALDLF